MKLSVVATTICLGFLQVLPAQALSVTPNQLREQIKTTSASKDLSAVMLMDHVQIARRPAGRQRSSVRSRPSQSPTSPPKRRSSRPTVRKTTPVRAKPARSPATSRPATIRRAKKRATPVKANPRVAPNSAPSVRRKQPQKRVRVKTPSAQRRPQRPPTATTTKPATPVKRLSPNPSPKAKPKTAPARPRTATGVLKARPTTKAKSPVKHSIPRKRVTSVQKPRRVVVKTRRRKPVYHPTARVNHRKSVKIRPGTKHRWRRVIRQKRSVPYWGKRRVRSRRLTRAYRPCYYCPGRGWSYSPICYTRASRYYIYSDSYFRLWPGITSYTSRRSYSEQSLVKQVEIAIRDYAELYELDTLEDDIDVTQEGSIIVFSGEVETEEILEDLVAIARDIEGVRYVVTEDVMVQEPIDSFEQTPLLDRDEPLEQIQEALEPELVFTTAVEDSAE